ncbi:MAG TPA: mechanosensitive ion channel family protein [Thermoplasmata archaeon]|nr:mechanosensitive ion channel family protein [Thermoplasmata archaeon]
MDPPQPGRPLWILARDLLAAVVLAGALFVLFTVFNQRLLSGFTAPEVLLLEAGAIVLVAFLVARAVANATGALLQRHGLTPRGHAVRLFLNLLIATGTVLALFKLAGVSLESIFIGAGFAGIVLGLASQTVLSNVFAGMLLVLADPFRPGDHVAFIASQYGVLAPSYPHEQALPAYTGTVDDVGLTYTAIALDSGGMAKVPNAIVIQAMVVLARGPVVHRVRMTFPYTTPVAAVEAAMADVAREFPPPYPGAPAPRLEATDLSATTWDAVIVLWSAVQPSGVVRDRVIRCVLPHLGRSSPG